MSEYDELLRALLVERFRSPTPPPSRSVDHYEELRQALSEEAATNRRPRTTTTPVLGGAA